MPRYPNAVSSYLQTADTTLASTIAARWTLAARVRLPAAGETGTAIITTVFTGGANPIPWLIGVSETVSHGANGEFFSGFYNGSWRIARTGVVYTPSVWTHVCGTWDGTTISLYINGTLSATNVPGSSPSTTVAGMRIGHRWDGTNEFNGEIEEAVIWNDCLSRGEVLSLSQRKSPLGIRPGNMMAYWPLDDYVGAAVGGVKDRGPDAYHLSLTGTVLMRPPTAAYTVADLWVQLFAADLFAQPNIEVPFIASTTQMFEQQIDRPVFVLPLPLRWSRN